MTLGVKGRPAAPKRHARKCRVCRHPSRLAIESDFLQWRSPEDIARSYPSLSTSMIYRHVHATGLYLRRFTPLCNGLERILEISPDTVATAHMIIHASRAYSRLPDVSDAPLRRPPEADPQILIGNPSRIDHDSTH